MPYARKIHSFELDNLKDALLSLYQAERVLSSMGAEFQAETVRDVRDLIKSIADSKGHDFLEQFPKGE